MGVFILPEIRIKESELISAVMNAIRWSMHEITMRPNQGSQKPGTLKKRKDKNVKN